MTLKPIRRFGRVRHFPEDTADHIEKWLSTPKHERPMIQDEFRYLSADDREFILSGATPEEWDRMWKEG